ncbi:hypothetical protein C8R45DRAFT_1081808 [Mycena sanguinolenta]|nr:hypothetical protein C8R45DRAFT_1081808 [Mycena sanguinolenta]
MSSLKTANKLLESAHGIRIQGQHPFPTLIMSKRQRQLLGANSSRSHLPISTHDVPLNLCDVFVQPWRRPSLYWVSGEVDLGEACRSGVMDLQLLPGSPAHCITLNRYEEARTHFEETAVRFKDLPGGADLHHAGEAPMELLETRMYLGVQDLSEFESFAWLAQEAQARLSHDETDKLSSERSSMPSLYDEKLCFQRPICRSVKDALRQAEQSGEVALICRILSTTAGYLVVLGSYQEASLIFTRLLPLSQAVGAPLRIAQALELLAYNCAAMTDLSTARVAYEGAQIHFMKIESTVMGGQMFGQSSDARRPTIQNQRF